VMSFTESFLSKKSSERGLTRSFLFRSVGVGRDALLVRPALHVSTLLFCGRVLALSELRLCPISFSRF
jgi:hypothetical protein